MRASCHTISAKLAYFRASKILIAPPTIVGTKVGTSPQVRTSPSWNPFKTKETVPSLDVCVVVFYCGMLVGFKGFSLTVMLLIEFNEALTTKSVGSSDSPIMSSIFLFPQVACSGYKE